MTREEAIEMLTALNMMMHSPDGEPISDVCDALGMAIEALLAENSNAKTQNSNQETQKSNGDLIKRADAIEAIDKQWLHGVNVPICKEIRTAIVQIISALPSAEAVQRWIPFTRRPMTEEEQKDYPNCTFMFDCVLPDDGDEILVSNKRFVWMDTFCSDIDGCYLDSGDDIDEDMAWMPLPKPYREDGEEWKI